MTTTSQVEIRELKKIGDCLRASCDEARKGGRYEGYLVAARIAQWWMENHKLVKPHSVETLTEWTNKALEEFQGKC